MAIWTVDQVEDWLKANKFDKYAEIFKNQDIDGIALLGLQDGEILKLLSTQDEHGTITNPTMRIQRKFKAALEDYRKLIKQERKKRRRSSSSINKRLDTSINNNENNLSFITLKATSYTINNTGTYSKIYTIESKSIGMKFFKSELICSNLTKYFLKNYNVTCHIPIQNQYDTKVALHIKLSGVKENVKNARNDIHSLLTTIKTKIFNNEDTDKKIIHLSKYIYSDSTLTILQKIFSDKKKLTFWEKTNILSGYYIVHYISGQHTFSVSEEFINHTVNNEISYVKDIVIQNVENIQPKFRKELDEFINDKKEQQLQYQTMSIIYCQYPFQTEMKISFFGLRNQVDIAKKQIKLLINKHRMRNIWIGLDSKQREFLLDNYVHEIKNLEIDNKDDNVKIQIRENIIIAPQYLIMKIKQLIQSMVFQTIILTFRYIKNAFILTEKDDLKLKSLAQNYNCEINKIDIETKKELIILPKGKNISTSKYIINESNQFYSSLSIWRKLSISNNIIEIHKSYDLTVDITIISTISDAIKENIDPKYGNGYFESDTGKRVLFIEWSPDLSQQNNNQINESIKKFISTSIKQIDMLCTNVVKTIAFATTDWENYDHRKQLAENILNEMINQLGSKHYSHRSWKIIFLFSDQQNEFFNEFSQVILSIQKEEDDYEQFFYPISNEIINDDDGIPLLARCAYEKNLDIETIQRPALRIIDAVSFRKDSAVKQIKENDPLMNHVKDLCDKNDKYQGAIAHRILWKVEEENEFISKQEQIKKQNQIKIKKNFDEKKAVYQYVPGDHHFDLTDQKNSEKFDLMISYYQDDKEICLKIYNRLIESDFYRVLFDKDNLHSSNPKIMAQAVEKSSVILMCFSTKYRNSYACRLEVEYAKKRQRPIIPIKIDHQYDPTGWLEEIIKNEKYIDFSKYEFTAMYAQLIDEIHVVNESINKK
ncbi:unnamed protein product [Rotaria sp. Silwood2]|nr:unnamed protein product [Rotaria sp. Silwood2]